MAKDTLFQTRIAARETKVCEGTSLSVLPLKKVPKDRVSTD